MLSKTCEYAMRTLICIALHYKEEERVDLKKITETINAPLPFVIKIMQQLAKAGLVISKKGPNGGFFLTEAQRNMPLINIIKLIDGNELFTNCILGLKKCTENKPCPLHFKFKPIKAELQKLFEVHSIETIKNDLETQKFFLSIS